MEQQRQLTVKDDPIYKMLGAYKGAISAVLPKHITPERMLRVSYQAIVKVPKLRNCSQISLINGIIEISTLGLDIGRTAHLIPFGKDAVVVVDYKGYIDLAHRSGQINALSMKSVYQNDQFDYQEGTERYIKHKPTMNERGELVAAYAICNYKHGGVDFELIFRPDAMAAKAVAPGRNSTDSPWNKPDQEHWMWEKTAVRRLAKRIPQSPELQRAVELEDLIDAGLKQDITHIIDADYSVPESKPEKPTQTDPRDAIKEKLAALKENGQTQHEILPDTSPEATEPEQPDTTIGQQGENGNGGTWSRSSWINLKSQGFPTYVYKNLDTFQDAPLWIKDEVIKKWESLFPDKPFPAKPSHNVHDNEGILEENNDNEPALLGLFRPDSEDPNGQLMIQIRKIIFRAEQLWPDLAAQSSEETGWNLDQIKAIRDAGKSYDAAYEYLSRIVAYATQQRQDVDQLTRTGEQQQF